MPPEPFQADPDTPRVGKYFRETSNSRFLKKLSPIYRQEPNSLSVTLFTAEFFDTIETGGSINISASVQFPLFGLSSNVEILDKASTNIAVPAPAISADVEVLDKASTTIAVPVPAISTNVEVLDKVSATILIPVPALTGDIEVLAEISTTVEFPVPELSGTLFSPPFWLPEGAVVYADFVNGHYFANGAERSLAYMLTGTYDPPTSNGLEVLVANSSRPEISAAVRDQIMQHDHTFVIEFLVAARIDNDTRYAIFSEDYEGSPGGSWGVTWEDIPGAAPYEAFIWIRDEWYFPGNDPFKGADTSGTFTNTILRVAAANTSVGFRGSWLGDPTMVATGEYINISAGRPVYLGHANYGAGDTDVLNGYIRKIEVYDTIKSDAELEALSTVSVSVNISGDIAFAVPAISADVEVLDKVSATFALPTPSLSGNLEVLDKATVSVAFPTPLLSGSIEILDKVTASIAFYVPALSGNVEVLDKVSTTIAFPVSSISALTEIIVKATSVVALPTPALTGNVDVISKITSLIEFEVPTVSASIETLTYITADLELPLFAVDGFISLPIDAIAINADIPFPAPLTAGNIELITEASADIPLGPPQITALIEVLDEITSALPLPVPVITAAIDPIIKATSNAVLPTPSLSASIKSIIKSTASAILPTFVLNAAAKILSKISSVLVFPVPELSGNIGATSTISGDVSLPIPIATAAIHLPLKVYSDIALYIPDITSELKVLINISGDVEFPKPITVTLVRTVVKLDGDLALPVFVATGAIGVRSFFYRHLDGVGGIIWPPALAVENAVSEQTREHNRLTEEDRYSLAGIAKKSAVFVKAKRD